MDVWKGNKYVIKQKVLTVGRKYFIEDGSGNRIGFCKQKLFKLKEDIRIYTDDSLSKELLLIKQEQILDWSGTFRVTDAKSDKVIGYVGRKALKSLFRDTWKIFDAKKNEIGTVEERGDVFSVLRRFIGFLKFVPKKYDFSDGSGELAEAIQKFQIIGDTWTLNIKNTRVDPRLIVTAALMMDIVEQQRGG